FAGELCHDCCKTHGPAADQSVKRTECAGRQVISSIAKSHAPDHRQKERDGSIPVCLSPGRGLKTRSGAFFFFSCTCTLIFTYTVFWSASECECLSRRCGSTESRPTNACPKFHLVGRRFAEPQANATFRLIFPGDGRKSRTGLAAPTIIYRASYAFHLARE